MLFVKLIVSATEASSGLLDRLFAHGGVLERWQTLIAGGLAIIAALIGGAYVSRQTTRMHQLAAEERRREFGAARAALPLTLSTLSDYADHCVTALREILAQANGEAIPQNVSRQTIPTIPPGVVNDLVGLARHGNESLYRAIAVILIELQVQASRMRSLWRDLERDGLVVTVSNVEDYIIHTAEVYARATALFGFARGESENVPNHLTYEQIRSALNLLGVYRLEYERIHATAESRYRRRALREEATYVSM